jgi:hypothetical protein
MVEIYNKHSSIFLKQKGYCLNVIEKTAFNLHFKSIEFKKLFSLKDFKQFGSGCRSGRSPESQPDQVFRQKD